MDELFQDYVRTAKAKGLSNKVIMFKHILRNALIPHCYISRYAGSVFAYGDTPVRKFFKYLELAA